MPYRNRLLISLFIILCMAGLGVVYASDVDERVIFIREGFKDGLDDMVRDEAVRFLKEYGQSEAKGEVSLILGILEKRRKSFKSAIRHLRTAAADPDQEISGQASYELAALFWKMQDYKNAAIWFEKAEEFPRNHQSIIRVKYWAGLSLFKTGSWEPAISAFNDSILELSGEDLWSVLYYRAVCFFNLKQIDLGLTDLETLYFEGSDEWKLQAGRKAINVLLKMSDDPLLDLWCSRLALVDNGSRPDVIRGNLAFKNKNWRRAQCFYTSAIKKKELSDPEVDSCKLLAAISQCRFEKEAGGKWWFGLMNFIAQNPANPHLDQIIGELSNPEGLPVPVEAIDYLTAGTDWSRGKLSRLVSNLYLKANDSNNALYWITWNLSHEKGLSLSKENRIALVKILQAAGDTTTALHELDTFSGMDSGNDVSAEETLLKADLLFQSEQFTQAAALYQQYVIEHPESSFKTMFWLGESYYRIENWTFAVSAFSAVLNRPDISPEYRENTLRRILLSYFNLMDWNGCIVTAKTYLKEFKDSEAAGEVLFRKGLAEANSGQYDPATISLSQALDRIKNPEYVENIKKAMRQIQDARSSEQQPAGDENLNPDELIFSTEETLVPKTSRPVKESD